VEQIEHNTLVLYGLKHQSVCDCIVCMVFQGFSCSEPNNFACTVTGKAARYSTTDVNFN